MKRLVGLFGVLLLSPLLMGAVSNHSVPGSAANPELAPDSAQVFDINSDNFGWNGPFSLSAQYSRVFGYNLQIGFVQNLNTHNAVALKVAAGRNQRRVNATIAHVLTPYQRVKVSVEHLAQRSDFGFVSGNVTKWLGQNSYGATYQYLLNNSLFHDINININTFYSKAQSRDLSTVQISDDFDYRHIAGATDKSLSVGTNIIPIKTTLFGLKLNYDNVHYNMHYEAAPENINGLGATVTLQQLVTKHIKFKLLASDRKLYKTYQASIGWLINTAPGTTLELSLIGNRIIVSDGLVNDSNFMLNTTYSFGGNTNFKPSYSLSDSNGFSDLRSWTKNPAVYMERVLAVKDERVVDSSPNINSMFHSLLLNNPNAPYVDDSQKIDDFTVKAGDDISIKLLKTKALDYFTDPLSYFQSLQEKVVIAPDGSGIKGTFTAKLDERDSTLIFSGKVNALPPGTDFYTVIISAKNLDSDWINETFKIYVKSIEDPSVTNVKNPNYQIGQKISGDEVATAQANDGVFNDVTEKTVKVFPNGNNGIPLSDFGLKANPALQSSGAKMSITLSTIDPEKGILKSGSQGYSIWVKNSKGGVATKVDAFKITVAVPGAPTVTIHPHGAWTQGETITTPVDIADITAGSGTLKSTDVSDLSSYFETVALPKIGDESGSVIVSGKVLKVTDGIHKIAITATNSYDKPTTENFDLIVSPAIVAPTVTIHPHGAWTQGETITTPVDIADITAGSGTLKSTDVSDLSSYFETVALPRVGDESGSVTVSGKVLKATDGVHKIAITATNSYDKPTAENFDLTVNPAIVAPTVTIHPHGAWTQGETITTPVDIADITAGSGTLKNTDVSDLSSYFETVALPKVGDESGSVTVSGKVLKATDGIHKIAITATNSHDKPTAENFDLIVNPAIVAPTVTIHPHGAWAQGETITTPVDIADITAGSGTLKSTDVSDLSSYFETVALPRVGDESGTVTVSGKVLKATDGIHRIAITATNSYDKAITENFDLTVNRLTFLTCPSKLDPYTGAPRTATTTDTAENVYVFDPFDSGGAAKGDKIVDLYKVIYDGEMMECVYDVSPGVSRVDLKSNVPGSVHISGAAKFKGSSSSICYPGDIASNPNCELEYTIV